jgi:trk/ktr system potassium uptake protein
MAEGVTAVTYPVRLPAVAHYLSQLAGMVGILALPPVIVAVWFAEWGAAARFLAVTAVLAALAWGGRRIRAPESIQANEALVVVSLTFVLTPLIMSFPLAASGLPYRDVLFEAVSAITTTGLSAVDSVEARSPVFLFARAWLQWCGGLGIAVLSVALLMGHHVAARRLSEPASNGNLETTARMQARQVLRVYLILTLTGCVLLWFVIGDGFVSLVHMLATLSTGGFSTLDDSIAGLPRAGAWVVTVFSFLGAIPLLLYSGVLAGKPRLLVSDPEVRALLVLVLVATATIATSLHAHSDLGWGAALVHGAMLGTSAQTTTGFASLDVGSLDQTSKLLLMASMIVGGGAGSTAGGIKLLRFLIVLRLVQHFLRRAAMPPHAVAQPRLAGQALKAQEIERAVLVIALFAMTVGVSWLVFVAHGYDPVDALFEVTSATGTVGLSTGITSSELPAALKLVLSLDMLLGRVEVFALLVLLYPRTWLRKRA